ncbi:GMC oxidoreductase [Ramaria rubella]|nr:GMC oxidoreductase [Ramaria rubella]
MPLDNAPSFCVRQFDYLIVGGGTAGLALAARLSEDPKVVVGVLEAGEWEEHSVEINTPGLALGNVGHPKFDWSFMSVPQAHANKRTVFQPRGKALGGSSSVNFLAFTRKLTCIQSASSGEYDALEKLGNPGWNWSEFLKYMKKSETTMPTATDLAKRYGVGPPDHDFHGDSGPIIKAHPTWACELEWPLISTMNALGVSNNPDAGDGDNVGVGICFSSVDTRTVVRSYAANAYYGPNSQRPNLFLVTGAHVSRIILERNIEEGLVSATGVEFVKDERKYTATASREVILSAGSFQTPQILELSGIGRKDVLSEFGIQQVIDLPGVGENLRFCFDQRFKDHMAVQTIHEIDSTVETLDIKLDDLSREKNVQLSLFYAFSKTRQGILASPPSASLTFIPTNTFAPEHKIKEWEATIRATFNPNASTPTGLSKQYEFQKGWLSDSRYAQAEIISVPGFIPGPGRMATPGSHYSSIAAGLMHPFSRGTVHISSPDPLAPPAIDPNLDMLLHTLKFVLRDGTIGGSPSMLPREDNGVVDASLRVYGTANLRVVVNVIWVQADCSIIPLTIAYAVGEKV